MAKSESPRDARKHNAKAEFDSLADTYHDQHKANTALTGEEPEYFAEYKIADLASTLDKRRSPSQTILDFGCGIGNSIPFFRKYFSNSQLHCADVSLRSIEIAQARFPGSEQYLLLEADIPKPANSFDLVFSACVFHHIPPAAHQHWLSELLRVARPGGILAIYEHNPLNPLTVHAVNTCPLDENAHLIRGKRMCRKAQTAGWHPELAYKLFFPAALSALRPLEQHMEWCFLGAQYRMLAYKPK